MIHDLYRIWNPEYDGEPGRRGRRTSDDLLRLIFVACHPVLSVDARSLGRLLLLGGFDARVAPA